MCCRHRRAADHRDRGRDRRQHRGHLSPQLPRARTQPPQIDWGGLLTNRAQVDLREPGRRPRPAAAIATSAIAFGFTGEALARATNPLLWTRGSTKSEDAAADLADEMARLPWNTDRRCDRDRAHPRRCRGDRHRAGVGERRRARGTRSRRDVPRAERADPVVKGISFSVRPASSSASSASPQREDDDDAGRLPADSLPRRVSGTISLHGQELREALVKGTGQGTRDGRRDRLPGSARLAEPGADNRDAADGDADHPRRAQQETGTRPRDLVADRGAHPGREQADPALPARILRRNAPAGDDRDGPDEGAGAAPRRRAHHRARRPRDEDHRWSCAECHLSSSP